MLSTLHRELSSDDGAAQPENQVKNLKTRVGDQLDDLAVFALVVLAVFYIAVASCWFFL
jgi:hypothetical protein